MENALTKTQRYDNIDLMECLAMLFVVVYHSTTGKYTLDSLSAGASYVTYLLRSALSTCVPLFFFANGFLLFNRPFHLKKHMVKTLRLTLLTLLWGVITLLLLMPIEGEYLSASEFWTAMWQWHWKHQWINHLWYMGALVGIYLAFPLLKVVFDSSKKVYTYGLAVCALLTFGNVALCMAATLLNCWLRGGKTYIAVNLFNMFNPLRGVRAYTLAYFCLGGLVGSRRAELEKKIRTCRYLRPACAVLALVCATLGLGLWGVFVSRLTGGIWDVVWDGYDTVFTLVNVMAIYVLSVRYKNTGSLLNRWVKTISCNTLGIYFMHEIFIHWFQNTNVGSLPFVRTYLMNSLVPLAILSLCAAVCVLLKKLPLVKELVR